MIATHGPIRRPHSDSPVPERKPLASAQSLADGDVAKILLAVELAATSRDSWDGVTDALLKVTTTAPDESDHAGLFYGAPALGFVLDATGIQHRAQWAHELSVLDRALIALTAERLDAVASRRQAGAPVQSSEHDLMSGLTGLGIVLLRRVVHQPTRNEELSRALSQVLSYMVDRAQDRVLGEVLLPGWWTPGPQDATTPDSGYADFGMARGGASILALLASSFRAGHTVPGQAKAIGHISSWYSRWRQETTDKVVWWPHRLTLDELHTGRVYQAEPSEPTWAHGTPGIGRALQMAAIALRDELSRVAAEDAIASCLTQAQLDRMTEPDLYSGTGGMYLAVLRAAEDSERFRPLHGAGISRLTHRLGLAGSAVSRTSRALSEPHDTEFLWGRFGTRLVFESLRRRSSPVSGCDGVLGIGWVE